MSKLPRSLKPTRVIKALQKAGFEIDHTTGSHFVMKKGTLRTTVPYHKSVKTGTLRTILRQAGITLEEFLEML
ncbi:MAG: type II toxin-antitoxin system HicA family toxin [Acidobacteria bacterium]|nr:type II toxin-antitoxin system HicA family toxin [Acidobacteriota bacterium]